MKTISVKKQKQHRKPWTTNGVLKAINIKNELYGTFMKTGNHSYNSQHKLYRDELNHIIGKVKVIITKTTFQNINLTLKRHGVE